MGVIIPDPRRIIPEVPVPRCLAYPSVNVSIADAAWVYINLNSELYDYLGMHDNLVNPSRITIPNGHDGLYLIHGAVTYLSNLTGHRVIQLYLNRADLLVTSSVDVFTSTVTPSLNFSFVAELASLDYLEIRTKQVSGGALDVAGHYSATHLSAFKLW